jgi:hypothetical protein
MNPLLLIPAALQIIGTLTGASKTVSAVTGIGGDLVKMLTGEKAGDVATAVLVAAKRVLGTDDPKQIELLIAQDRTKADLALAQMAADTERFKIQVEDTQDARARDTAIREQSGSNPRANVMLAGNFACIIAITLGLLFYRESMPDGIAAILGALIGNLATMLTQAFNFEFGSSRGSSEKSNQLTEMLTRQK